MTENSFRRALINGDEIGTKQGAIRFSNVLEILVSENESLFRQLIGATDDECLEIGRTLRSRVNQHITRIYGEKTC